MLSISVSHSPHPVCNLKPASLLHLRESAGSMAVSHLQYSRLALPTSALRSLERDKLSTRSPDTAAMKTLHLCVPLVTTGRHICTTSLPKPTAHSQPSIFAQVFAFLVSSLPPLPKFLSASRKIWTLNYSLGLSCLSLTLVTSGIKSNCLAL